MKKIIGMVSPIAPSQQIYVYEDGNKVEMFNVEVDNITSTVFSMIDQYTDIEQVELFGPKQYANGIAKKIKEAETSKYSNRSIEVIVK
jgi:stalled ribosome rescue protein Dom34